MYSLEAESFVPLLALPSWSAARCTVSSEMGFFFIVLPLNDTGLVWGQTQ